MPFVQFFATQLGAIHTMKLARILVLSLILVLGMSVVYAQDAELGSPENPIQVFFVPSAESQTLISGGEVLAEALTEATGLSFEVSVPTSYAATIEAIPAAILAATLTGTLAERLAQGLTQDNRSIAGPLTTRLAGDLTGELCSLHNVFGWT